MVTFKRFANEQSAIQAEPNLLKNIVREELMPYINYQYAAYKVIGSNFKKTNKAERAKFVPAFREYLITSYAQVFTLYNNQKVEFAPAKDFSKDRVVSVEMFEHVRNYQQLFSNISAWLKDDGLLFIHVFCHRFLMYPFEEEGDDNWMGKYFFSGGQMPAFDTFLNFQEDLNIQKRWAVSGTHYEQTSNHWLENTDKHKDEILSLFQSCYGQDAELWFQRWRMFFMSCAELFGYEGGTEWLVGHYLFSNNKSNPYKVQ